MLVGADRFTVDDAPVHRGAIAQGIGEVVAPRVDRVQRQGEGKRQGEGDADQDVDAAPQTIGDRVVAMPGDDEHRDRREQGGVAALANRVIREKTAHHGHGKVGQPRHAQPGVLRHQGQSDPCTDQGADGALGGFFADVAVVLQTADHHQHGHRCPFAVGQVDASSQQNRRQQPQRHAHGMDQSGVTVAPIRVQ